MSATFVKIVLLGWVLPFGGDNSQLPEKDTIKSLENRVIELSATDDVAANEQAALAQYRLYLELAEGEPERLHQVQRGPRVGAEAYDVPRVRRDLRAKQNQIEHSRVSSLRRRFQPARHHILRAPLLVAHRPAVGLRRVR